MAEPARTATGPSRVLRRYRSTAAPRHRLVLCPHAGGSASFFRAWPDALPADVDVWAVQYPGREQRLRDPMPARLAGLADEIADALVPAWSTGVPVSVLGHSMGACVAFEVVRRLEARGGGALGALFVSAHSAPHTVTPAAAPRSDADLRRLLHDLGGTARAVLDDPHLRELALAALSCDVALLDRYRPPSALPAIATPVVILAGDRDPVLDGSLRRWGEVTTGAAHSRTFPGGHFYLTTQLEAVAAEVARHLR